VRNYRGENGKKYQNIKGLCKVATIDEVKKAGYSLNPGRYVGIADNSGGYDGNFEEKIENIHNELSDLTHQAHKLEKKITYFRTLKKLKFTMGKTREI